MPFDFGTGCWHTGLVSLVRHESDSTYGVFFDDEDERTNVPRNEIRALYQHGAMDWTPLYRPTSPN